jgi:hypothetical protein
MIYAGSKLEIEAKRKALIHKWRLKCRAVADSLEEAGDKLFTFTRFPKRQWKSIRKAPDQDPDRSAISGNSSHVVLGLAGFRADHNAQSRRLADLHRKASPSGD